ncbi:MAG: HAD-IIIA family hydrolase [Syntrophobacterales bacterium]|nr:HAD-IIIA family hydrolase [Syntrophobacterales bacterium]
MTMGITDEKLLNKLRRVKLFISDVDGVLTDGTIVVNDEGLESKQFNVRDGHGLKLLLRYGIDVVLVTGRQSRAVEWRATDLGITEVHQGIRDKGKIFEEIIKRRNVPPDETACIGDDIVDIPIMRKAGLSIAVFDAVREVREDADYVTTNPGGRGAVREVCEMILKAQGLWGDIVARYGLDNERAETV